MDAEPLRRRYWELVGERGRNVVVFHDLCSGGWFLRVIGADAVPAIPPYVELHCHSAYSFLDGVSLPEDSVARGRAGLRGDRADRPQLGVGLDGARTGGGRLRRAGDPRRGAGPWWAAAARGVGAQRPSHAAGARPARLEQPLQDPSRSRMRTRAMAHTARLARREPAEPSAEDWWPDRLPGRSSA